MSGGWWSRIDSYVTISKFVGTDSSSSDSMFCAGGILLFVLSKENERTCVINCMSLIEQKKVSDTEGREFKNSVFCV